MRQRGNLLESGWTCPLAGASGLCPPIVPKPARVCQPLRHRDARKLRGQFENRAAFRRAAAQGLTRRESWVFGGEPVERFGDLVDAHAVGVAQRATSEWGEAGAEDHCQIDVVGQTRL